MRCKASDTWPALALVCVAPSGPSEGSEFRQVIAVQADLSSFFSEGSEFRQVIAVQADLHQFL